MTTEPPFFSDAHIRELITRPGGGQGELRVGPNLYLLMRGRGVAYWSVRYTMPGEAKQRRAYFGKYHTSDTALEMIQRVKTLLELREHGMDPAEALRQMRGG